MDDCRVWRRFESTAKDGSVYRMRIQNAPLSMYPDVVDFMTRYFMRDETFNKAIDLAADELAVKEFCDYQGSFMSSNFILVCFMDDEKHYDMVNDKPQILGFSMTIHMKKDIHYIKIKPESARIQKLFQAFHVLDKDDDTFERYGVDEYLGDAGLSVHPDYRGLGIASELLKARVDVCRELGFKLTTAFFTSKESQKSAEKSGFKTMMEIPYSLVEQVTQIKYNNNTDCVKLMSLVL